MLFKCKMCGGELNIEENMDICICPYCKTKQTIPNTDDEKEKQLHDRANYYRLSNEFDRAITIYEQILEKNSKDPEAYWGVLLCRYGVEYVEDNKTKKRIPTCHRTCYDSILEDINYKEVLKYASGEALKIYKEEAKYIDDVQKKIKEISSKEKPYDIFICYKESNGEDRTIDSVLAQDIYNNLTEKGYKVFFSRISLEGKLGAQYEPYIYSALTTSKIMLVVGTSIENLNSVWVKNEWKRYLSLINEGKKKVLIPCYKKISPYDLPDEFSMLQAQDMGKVGAMQDLLRGIDKIIKPTKEQIDADSVNEHILKNSLTKAFEYLSQGSFKEAAKRLDNALDYSSSEAMIYIGYLLIDLHLNTLEDLENYSKDYFNNENYKKAIKFADKKLKEQLDKYKANTEKILEEKNKEKQKEIKTRKKILIIFLSIFMIMILTYLIIFKLIIPSKEYKEALKVYDDKNYEEAYELFNDMNYKDSKEKKYDCAMELQLKLIEDGKTSYHSKFSSNIDKLGKERLYKVAKAYYDKKEYKKYIGLYENIKSYKDSDEMYSEVLYLEALENYNSKEYLGALKGLENAKKVDNQKAKEELERIKEELYQLAVNEYNNTNYGTAKEYLDMIIDYKDSKDKYNSCNEKINQEKSRYYGVWYEAQGFWTNLKIDENKIYAGDEVDTKRDDWSHESAYSYDEDNATLSFTYWDGHSYSVSVRGNTLYLTCTNLKDQYDSDWFGEYNVFYRG